MVLVSKCRIELSAPAICTSAVEPGVVLRAARPTSRGSKMGPNGLIESFLFVVLNIRCLSTQSTLLFHLYLLKTKQKAERSPEHYGLLVIGSYLNLCPGGFHIL